MPSTAIRENRISDLLPPVPETKISTGIKRMDELMYGGYSKGDNVLIYGGVYSQKKNYMYNFIASAVRNGMNVLILALDTPVDEIMKEIGKRDDRIDDHLQMIHIIDGFSRKYQEKPPENVIPIEDSYNMSHVIKTINASSMQYHPCAFVMLSATQYLISEKEESIKFIHQICYMRRNSESVSIYMLDDFAGEKIISEVGYAMDISIRFTNNGDDDHLQVHTLRNVRTRDPVRIYQSENSFYLGSFNVERIK
ncbi:MAG: RAD55 family ATPase [Thermoplasmata archaeon]